MKKMLLFFFVISQFCSAFSQNNFDDFTYSKSDSYRKIRLISNFNSNRNPEFALKPIPAKFDVDSTIYSNPTHDWVSYEKHVMTYNDIDSLDEDVLYLYQNKTWKELIKDKYVYNGNKQLISLETYIYDPNTNEWSELPDNKASYFYNSKGKIDSVHSFTNSVDDGYILYQYNDEDKMITSMIYLFINSMYVPYKKHEYTYSDGVMELEKISDYIDGEWFENKRFEHVYNKNGKISQIRGREWVTRRWEDFDRITYNYDDNGVLIATKKEVYADWSFREYSRTNYTNNDKYQPVEVITDYPRFKTWEANAKEKHEYNEDGLKSKILKYIIDESGNWELNGSFTYEYYENGKMKTFQSDYFDGSAWFPEWKDELLYNEQNLESQRMMSYFIDGNWKNTLMNRLTYDGAGKLLYDTNFEYVDYYESPFWRPSSVTINEYDEFGLLTVRTEKLFDTLTGLSTNFSKEEFLYNQNNLEDKTLRYIWMTETQNWLDISRYEHKYDNENRHSEFIYLRNFNGTYQPYNKGTLSYDLDGNNNAVLFEYYHEGFVYPEEFIEISYKTGNDVVFENIIDKIKLEISPVPANDFVVLKLELPAPEPISIDTYDISGKRISKIQVDREIVGLSEYSIPTETLPQGIYIVKVNGSNWTKSIKFNVVR